MAPCAGHRGGHRDGGPGPRTPRPGSPDDLEERARDRRCPTPVGRLDRRPERAPDEYGAGLARPRADRREADDLSAGLRERRVEPSDLGRRRAISAPDRRPNTEHHRLRPVRGPGLRLAAVVRGLTDVRPAARRRAWRGDEEDAAAAALPGVAATGEEMAVGALEPLGPGHEQRRLARSRGPDRTRRPALEIEDDQLVRRVSAAHTGR